MPNSRSIRFLFLAILAGLALTACSDWGLAEKGPIPDNTLTITISNDGRVEMPVQELFTDKPATLLHLNFMSNGKMLGKFVSVVSISRTDRTSDMKLGGVKMNRLGQDKFGGGTAVLLPHGTYGLLIDGVTTQAVIRVSPRLAPSPTAK